MTITAALVKELRERTGAGLNALFDLLSKRGVKISSMRNRSNRLEELFIRLVSENGGEVATTD